MLLLLFEALTNLCKIEVEEVISFESPANDVLLDLIGTSHHFTVLAFSRTHAVLIRGVLESAPKAGGSILGREDGIVPLMDCVWMIR